MEKRPRYEYDAEMQILVKIPAYRGLPTVISKRVPHWGDLGPEYESYARAIYLGQGCWERLETISEERAQKICGVLHNTKIIYARGTDGIKSEGRVYRNADGSIGGGTLSTSAQR